MKALTVSAELGLMELFAEVVPDAVYELVVISGGEIAHGSCDS